MSGYFAKVSNISGGSTVAKSAYMSREEMKDETQNYTYNYSNHEHDNTFSNVYLCKNAPHEYQDKNVLWNEVEKAENGKNTRKAKQWILGVPQEMSQEESEKATVEFQEWLSKKGMCSQADIHMPDSQRSASKIEKNKHVHVMATQRLIDENGEWERIKEKKVYANCMNESGKPAYNPNISNDTEHRIPKIDPETGEQKIGARNRKEWHRVTIQDNPLNKKELIEESREQWSNICNQYLSAEQKIDHRSYEKQGIDKIAEIHEGVGSHKEHDERADYNKQVREVNAKIEQLKKDIPKQIKEEKEKLNDVRAGNEHDGDHRGTEQTNNRYADHSGREQGRDEELEKSLLRSTFENRQMEKNSERLGKSVHSMADKSGTENREQQPDYTIPDSIAEVSEQIAGVREQLQRERSSIENCKRGIGQRIGENAAGMRARAWETISDKLRTSLREKFQSIQENIRELGEKYNSLVRERNTAKTTEQPDKGLEKPTSKPINENRSDDTMSAMSRFNQIEAERKQKIAEKEAREKSGIKEDKPADSSKEEKPSIMDKLNKWEKEKKENRQEPLKNEQNQENETIHHHRGHHR